MAARTLKRSRERPVPYKILKDLTSVDLLFMTKKAKEKEL